MGRQTTGNEGTAKPGKALALINSSLIPKQKWRRPYVLQALAESGSLGDLARNVGPSRAGRSTSHLTVRELAERFKINEGTLSNWRGAGVGPRFIKVGSLVRYPLVEVEAWEANQLKTNRQQ